MTEQRPSPEKLLQQIAAAKHNEQSGKLKIYLGAAPGVGKTHAMLRDALSERAKGLDIVVGVVESHGRQEIETMLKNLEIIPKIAVEYRDQKFLEFDLDGVLRRDPKSVLIDELAHTNVPGLRHTKRWQDIKECLEKGIDVYTTLNVQHIESLNDNIAQIIHIKIRETVPDSIIELADIIELIDLPPEELLERLREGKIYFPKQAELAAESYFTQGNLIALREVALRTAANRVGTQAFLYRKGQGITQIWPIMEKILVCVGPDEEAFKLIRGAKRLATSLQAEWIAVYIDTPLKSAKVKRDQAIKHLRFAEQLGGVTFILTGIDVVKEIMAFAREQNVTQIMVWQDITKRWRDLFFQSLASAIVRHSGDIDVYIMTGERKGLLRPRSPASPPESMHYKIYLIIAAITTLIIIINFYSFKIKNVEYLLPMIIMFLVVLMVSNLTIINRRLAKKAQLSERNMAALYMLSRQLAMAHRTDDILQVGKKYITQVFESEVTIFLSSEIAEISDVKEKSIVQWVNDSMKIAGHGTETLADNDNLYLPLVALQKSIGVIKIRSKDNNFFSQGQMYLLEACADQIAATLNAKNRDNYASV